MRINVFARKLLLGSLLCFFPLLSVASVSASANHKTGSSGDTLRFGIVPQQSAVKLAKKWMPILKHLEQHTGIKVLFGTAPSISSFHERMGKGEYDLIYTNPYHYTLVEQSVGYTAFAKAKNRYLQGIVVVKSNSRITELSQLQGEQLAFPSPTAFAATILIQADLAEQGVFVTPKFVQSHDSVYHNVLEGNAIAGGGIHRTLNNFGNEKSQELRILFETRKVTPHAFAAHPRVPKSQVEQLAKVLTNMSSTEEGASLLAAISFNAIERAEPKDWADIRKMDFSSFITPHTKQE